VNQRRAAPLVANGQVANSSDDAPLLEVSGVEVAYGPVQVLFGVDLVVRPGRRIAVLGHNGVGKSTLLRVINGRVEPSAGTVRFKGEDVTGLPTFQRARRGMSLVEGGRGVFPSLTVRQNLQMGAYEFLNDDALVDERIGQVLDVFPALRLKLAQTAGTLSGGEQQMLALGRSLMADPDIYMFDELSLGLAPIVVQHIVAAMEKLVERGKTILLVEQSVNIALAIAEDVYFMEKGEISLSATTSELLDDPELLRTAFFGTGDEAVA
jgi:ABC-type branched-subunit amino acid transport system ATPase component